MPSVRLSWAKPAPQRRCITPVKWKMFIQTQKAPDPLASNLQLRFNLCPLLSFGLAYGFTRIVQSKCHRPLIRKNLFIFTSQALIMANISICRLTFILYFMCERSITVYMEAIGHQN